MGSVFTCKLNPCCGDRRNCDPPRQYYTDLRYDPAKDSTAGGNGPHRYDDPKTWELDE